MEHKHTNRLINESSPYLLQHAHNPVNWYPWGEDALEKALSEKKLLLISIGYSACHWCHVMEHESFEDEEVAKIMNDHFICIKVDREERPDVDQVYMDAVQLITGRGGWPLNCFALPDGRPIYGGTYYRKADWKSLLKQLSKLNNNEHERLVDQANAIEDGVLKQESAQIKDEKNSFNTKLIVAGMEHMAEGFDHQFGGFNGAPKFPMPSILNYLFAYTTFFKDEATKKHLSNTLNQIASGGIYDHIGGGFARYSVDERWFAPHFEKMLYDNAQLISVYSKVYQLTRNDDYKRVVYETINFIERELTSPDGVFFAALDADSEGKEGKYYVWTADELKYHLGVDYPLYAEYYSVKNTGNWEEGQNILHTNTASTTFSMDHEMQLNHLLSFIEQANNKLLAERQKRVKPGLDDKIITSWNALMIKAYVDAYRTFDNASFLKAAEKAASFINSKLVKEDQLMRTYKNETAKINGFLDDYAFIIQAYIELFQVTHNEQWIILAKKWTDHVITNFADNNSDFFFYTSKQDTPLAFRKKELGDNVIPGSNSVMSENLLKLSIFFGEPHLHNRAVQMLKTMAYEVKNYGRFYSNWGRIITTSLNKTYELVIVGEGANQIAKQLQNKVNNTVLFAASETTSELAIFKGRFVKGKTLIYVCENNACKLPVESVDEALNIITD